MSRTFSTMKTNVGNDVQDTSTTMSSLIGRYLNRRYMQVLRLINWTYYNEDYTISVVSGTQDYTLPSDFGKELYAVDVTNNTNLKKLDFEELVRDFSASLSTAGSISRYIVFNSDDGSKYVRFHYVPDSACTVNFPYIVQPSDMSADSDTPVINIEDALEIGATADVWRYKRQFSKAQQMELMFNQFLADFIWSRENQPNQAVQFKPVTYNKDDLV